MIQDDWLTRTELLLGKEKIKKIQESKVLIVGLGGVGAYAAECICRGGVSNLVIIDGDTINASNRNRQLPALKSTEGEFKSEVMRRRILDINPNINLQVSSEYLQHDRIDEILGENYDYVIDAIDTLAPKVRLIYTAVKNNLKIVSAMGAGGKLDPSQVKISDINDSYNCRLAFNIRKRLHRLGLFKGVKVVFSTEKVNESAIDLVDNELNKKSIVGTISYMPAVFGCLCASVVLRDLIE